MAHISSLFKTVALFCLATVLCPGCGFSSNKKPMLKAPNTKRPEKELVESGDAKKPEQSAQQSDDKKGLQNEVVSLLQEQFMPSYSTLSQPTAPTASQDANGALKEELWKGHKKDMRQVERMLAQSDLSDPQIKGLITLYKDTSCKLQEILLKLPPKSLQSICDCMKKQRALKEDIVNTFESLQDLLKKPIKSPEKGCQIDVKNNSSESIFQELTKATQEVCKIAQDYIHPEDHRNLQGLQVISALYTFLYEKMQAAFLACSAEEKESYQLHLERLLSLFKSSLKEARTLKQFIPNSLVGEIRALMLETAKKEAAMVGK